MDGSINFSGTLAGSIAGGGGGDVTDVKVRDSQETTFESVVNEQGVAEIDLISYVRRNELTQAIENVENSIDTKQNVINYSTEEQDTGELWVDEKPVFQKTIIIDNITSLSDTYNLNINFETIVDIRTVWKRGRLNRWETLDTVGEANYPQYRTFWQLNSDGTIKLEFTSYPLSDIQMSKVYITIKYTKPGVNIWKI